MPTAAGRLGIYLGFFFFLFLGGIFVFAGLRNSLKARKSAISQKVNNSKGKHITRRVLKERNVSVEDSLMSEYIFHEAAQSEHGRKSQNGSKGPEVNCS